MKFDILPFCYAIVLLVLASSCENEIPYNHGDAPSKLTLNGFIYADSLNNTLYLSMTGETHIQTAGSATVEVTVNGEQKQVLTAVKEPDNPLRTVKITTRFRPGDLVRIDARTDDGEHHAWVEETIPQPVAIEQIDTSSVAVSPKPYYNSESNLRFRIRFKDRPNEKNYYRIVLEQRHTIKGKTMDNKNASALFKYFGFWPWEDVALTDGRPATSEELDTELFDRPTNYYGVFHDSWFQNNEYTLNVLIATSSYMAISDLDFYPEYWDMDIAVRLLSITESEYYYLSTLNVMDSGILDEYLSDPVKIPSNVHGGNGFVGISSETGKIMRIVENGEVKYYDDYR